MFSIVKSAALAILALVVTTPLSGCGTTPRVHPMYAEVRALNDQLEDRLRAGDLHGVAALYADDGLLLSPGGDRVEGREAIDAYWMRMSDPVDWSLSIDALEGEEDLLVQRGTSRLVRMRDGAPRTSVVEFILVWARQPGGQLRAVVDAYW